MNTAKFTSMSALAIGAALLALPSMAADTCGQWVLQGPMALRHSNGTVVNLSNSQQSGSRFTAAGRYYPPPASNVAGPFGSSIIKHRDVDGHAVGTVVGNVFEATVYWGSTSVGLYTGQIGPQGQLVGHTRDKADPAGEAGFQSDRPLACASGAPGSSSVSGMPPSPAPQPGPIRIAVAAPPTAPSGPPRVLAPGAGSVHPAQTSLAIRLAPALGTPVETVELEIQVRSGAGWRVLTHIPVDATALQTVDGYTGWGAQLPGTAPQMTATPGAYRVRALATAPRRSAPGDWVEFRVVAAAGTKKVAHPAYGRLAKVPPTDAPRPQAHGTSPALGAHPVARTASASSAQATSPTAAGRDKANAVSLNPPPPSTLTPAQVPGVLR